MTHNRVNANVILSVLNSVRACTLCEDLALGPKPIIQLSPDAKILIVSQALGRKPHLKGITFDDTYGDLGWELTTTLFITNRQSPFYQWLFVILEPEKVVICLRQSNM